MKASRLLLTSCSAFAAMAVMASAAQRPEKVAVGKNMKYVLEVLRAEGTSEWRSAAHDEFALVVDGTVTVELVRLNQPAVAADPRVHEPVRRPQHVRRRPALLAQAAAVGREVARRHRHHSLRDVQPHRALERAVGTVRVHPGA